MHRWVAGFRNKHATNNQIGRHALDESDRHTNDGNAVVEDHGCVQETIPRHANEVIAEVAYSAVDAELLIWRVDIPALAWEEVKLVPCEQHEHCSMNERNRPVLDIQLVESGQSAELVFERDRNVCHNNVQGQPDHA